METALRVTKLSYAIKTSPFGTKLQGFKEDARPGIIGLVHLPHFMLWNATKKRYQHRKNSLAKPLKHYKLHAQWNAYTYHS